MAGATEGVSPAAVSGSAVAAQRQRALAESSTTAMLFVDSALRICLTAGASLAGRDVEEPGSLIGTPLVDAVDAPGERERIEQALHDAITGSESEIKVQTRSLGSRTLRFLPLAGRLRGGRGALVAITPEKPLEIELAELRTRASDLETLSSAARRLARSLDVQEVGGIVCETAAEVATCDFAALIEPRGSGSSLAVTASCGAELDGQISVDQPAIAAEAFRFGRQIFSDDLRRLGGVGAWPLDPGGALAGIWQPVRIEDEVRAVLAIGWRRRIEAPGERLKAYLELIADEAAVALERAAAVARLTVLARTDPLTDLSNRRAWQDELARELARAERAGERLSIGMIDLDELKAFNDRYGHSAGDRLLLTAAARWRRRLRLTDLIARIGGDEFAVTLPGCGLSEATALGDELRRALPDGLTCSIGVAEWSAGETAEALFDRADRALYVAKGEGRDRTVAAPTPAAAGA